MKDQDRFLTSRDLFLTFRKLMRQSHKVHVAVAYLTEEGLNMLKPQIEDFLRPKNHCIEFIVGLSDYYITEPSALQTLLRLKSNHPKQVFLGYYDNEGFHPKLFIFESAMHFSVIVGSSNLTWQGFRSNVEANLLFCRAKNERLAISVVSYFERLKRYSGRDLKTRFRTYESDYKRFLSRQRPIKRGTSTFKASRRKKTDLPCDYFVEPFAFNILKSRCKSFWKISPGAKGAEWDQWLELDGKGRIAIGWDEHVGRLSRFKSREELQSYIEANRRKWGGFWIKKGPRGGPKDPSWYVAQQLWRFYKGTKRGDVVVAYSDKTIFGVGKVKGPYYFAEDPEYFGHRKEVRWLLAPRLKVFEKDVIKALGGMENTIFKVDTEPMVRRTFDLLSKCLR